MTYHDDDDDHHVNPGADDAPCDCECHDDYEGVTATQAEVHAGRTCAAYQAWLDEDVLLRLSSLQNVTYRHDVSSGFNRREWLDADDDPEIIQEAITDAVLRYVEVTVLDDPRPA